MLMKFILGAGLVFMIFEAAIFGSFLMNHAMAGGHSGCLAADITGSGSCIQSSIMPGFLIGVPIISLFLLLFEAIGALRGSSRRDDPKRALIISRRREEERASSSAKLNLLAYLAFHENSPSFA